MFKRIYAIGDIHGCANLFLDLLFSIADDWQKTKTDFESPLILLIGDLIDRGPNSAEVLNIASRRHFQNIPIVSLLGNHDWMFGVFLTGGFDEKLHLPDSMENMDPILTWLRDGNGGPATLRSYGVQNNGFHDLCMRFNTMRDEALSKIPKSHINFIENMLPFYETDNYIFVHAGLDWDAGLYETHPLELLWIRKNFLYDSTRKIPGKIVVHGHTKLKYANGAFPQVTPGRINLDSGAYQTDILTCVVVGDAVNGHRFITTKP